ncbi:hypothetical protein FA95DRAFT_1561476 [Auriscalpium vulgare]|uniref:Uncharacterized protein n=1 Tax=Auriscalpium vulgare TaxID=40419 RepID=A0ACB8RMB4_9AGAM|nr:hypothetical protein FA95DRAFT_1561476 [Auriscalpium vulgare]
MAPADTQSTLRPSMRRKSSAQNLLSSFKPSAPAQPIAAPTPSTSGTSTPAIPSLSPSPLPYVPPATPGPSWTPTATQPPPPREWDAQSMHSDGTTSAPAGNQGASVEYLRDLVNKRIITLTYMRNVHEGRSHWFHTIMMSRAELDRVFNNAAMKKRTYRFAILAMSLSTLFDISQPSDLLRALLSTLTEYEQSKEEGERPKMRLWKRPTKRTAGMSDYSLNIPETSGETFLTIPHMPFPLDYTQTLLSLLDILSALYAKLAKLLGPSPFPHASQHMLGLAPHPGVSYLFQGGAGASQHADLWHVANGAGFNSGGMGSPPPSWTPALGELMLKVDSKFKKITSVLLKDLDAFARNGIKDELASLDPLLRNVGQPGFGAGEGRAVYDFE